MPRTCQETKPATDFYRYTYSKDGLYQQCKTCHARAGQSRLERAPRVDGKVWSGPPTIETLPLEMQPHSQEVLI